MLVLVLAGCGGGGAGADAAAVCPLVTRLAGTAEIVAQADLADPDAFAQALDAAVSEYVAILGELREEAPEELADDLDRLEAAVTQYDFDEAVRARAALDEFAGRSCGGTGGGPVGEPVARTAVPAGTPGALTTWCRLRRGFVYCEPSSRRS